MSLTLRPARVADLADIRHLINLYARERKLLRRSEKELKKLLRAFIVALQGDELVGCVALEVYSPKLAEVRSLAVHPSAQGLGVGSALIEACLKRAKSRKILEVMAITSSEAFFQKQGFDFALPNEKKALFYYTK